jgi:Ca-activated chloride channel homolog
MLTRKSNSTFSFLISTITVLTLAIIVLGRVAYVNTQAQDNVELACYERLFVAPTQTAQAFAPTWTAQAEMVYQTATALAATYQAVGSSTAQPSATQSPNQNPPMIGIGMTASAMPMSMSTSVAMNAQAAPPVGQVLPMTGGGGGGNAMVVGTPAPATPIAEEAAPPVDMFFEDYGINGFIETSQDNLSTFAMDVDTASYTLARNYLLQSHIMPDPLAIRPEEFINYFPTNYSQPEGDEAFAINLDAAPSPFRDETLLLRVGLQGRSVAATDREPTLLIFVVDVSGSMNMTNRLELAKQSMAMLVHELRQDDRVGIVIYANSASVVLEPTTASNQQQILNAIDSLHTEGSTYAEAGLCLGYQMALNTMQEGDNTRVILVSDGVANVGATGPDAILETIRAGVENDITLSTIGFGMGNFNDVLMEQLANDGNGNYYYVDTPREAQRIFVNNLTSTLQVIAYDAKIQIEFNPDAVTRYRLIGYENRAIADTDFRNDTIDAGEVGAGHTITALYEVELNPQAQPDSTIATAYIRYEDTPSREVVEVNETIALSEVVAFEETAEDFRLLVAVTEFSELLRQSPFVEDTSYSDVLNIVTGLTLQNPDIAELVQMITTAEQLSQQ